MKLLTEEILQNCFKQKTIFRNSEWDVIWDLGGKIDVRIGERSGKFYLLPPIATKPIVELLPEGLVQATSLAHQPAPKPIETLSELEKVYPELTVLIQTGKKLKDNYKNKKNLTDIF